MRKCVATWAGRMFSRRIWRWVVLLSTICARMNGKKKEGKKYEMRNFWTSHDFRAFKTNKRGFTGGSRERASGEDVKGASQCCTSVNSFRSWMNKWWRQKISSVFALSHLISLAFFALPETSGVRLKKTVNLWDLWKICWLFCYRNKRERMLLCKTWKSAVETSTAKKKLKEMKEGNHWKSCRKIEKITLFIPRITSTSSCSTFSFAFQRKSVLDTNSPCRSRVWSTATMMRRSNPPRTANGNLSGESKWRWKAINFSMSEIYHHDCELYMLLHNPFSLPLILPTNTLLSRLNGMKMWMDRKFHFILSCRTDDDSGRLDSFLLLLAHAERVTSKLLPSL